MILDAGSDAQKRRWLPPIADGSRIGTLALLEATDLLAPGGISLRGAPDGDGFVLEGEKRFVVDAETADLLVVAFRTGDGEDRGARTAEEPHRQHVWPLGHGHFLEVVGG